MENSTIEQLKQIFDREQVEGSINIDIDIKNLDFETKKECLKYAISREDLNNSYFILNIYNLIKGYNTLEQSYFDSKDTIAKDIEELINLKLELKDEIKNVINKVSFYFLSILKTYSKFHFSSFDTLVPMPNLYKNIIMSTDIGTLCGILNTCEDLNIKDCVYIQDSVLYLNTLIAKTNLSFDIMSKLRC